MSSAARLIATSTSAATDTLAVLQIEEYVKSDVYNQNGLITSYTIKPYLVVKE